MLSSVPLCAQTSTVTWTNVHQTIDGFGAANHGNPMTTASQTLFFQTLGYSLLRTGTPEGNNICNTISSACATGGDSVSDMLACVNNNCQVWASSWTPPANLKSNNNIACNANGGNGTLLAGSYGTYATYLSNYVASLKQFESFTLYGLSVQNEPNVCAAYDSQLFTGANFDTFIGTNLGPTMQTAGTYPSTKIFMPETACGVLCTGTNGAKFGWHTAADTCVADATCANFVSTSTYHGYWQGTSGDTNPLSGNFASKHYWETEDGNGSGYGQSASGCTQGTFCNTANDMIMWVTILDYNMSSMNVNSWSYWLYGPTPGNFTDNEMLENNTTVAHRAYAIANYAKFVRPGQVRIDATHVGQAGTLITAYKNSSTGAFEIVAINTNTSSVSQTFNFSGFPGAPTCTGGSGCVTPWQTSTTQNLVQLGNVTATGSGFTATLPAQSVTTFTGTSMGGVGNSCPSSALYASSTTRWNFTATLTSKGITGNCYYITTAANGGADTNPGTRESPWAHAPGMIGCAGTGTASCAGHTPVAGEGYIFEGNVVYPSSYFGWKFDHAGTSTNPIYIGKDPTWFTGASWGRPIFSCGGTAVCAGSDLRSYVVIDSGHPFIIIDDIEFSGLFVPNTNNYSGIAGCDVGLVLENNYMHNIQWNQGAVNAGNATGFYNGNGGCAKPTTGPTQETQNPTFRYNVFDNSDGSKNVGNMFYPICPTCYGNVANWTQGGLDGTGDDWDSNLVINNVFSANFGHQDAMQHTGCYTCINPTVYYNNVIAHTQGNNTTNPGATANGVPKYWINGLGGITVYFFNNSLWDNSPGNLVNLGSHCGSGTTASPCSSGTMILFNNTIFCGATNFLGSCAIGPNGTTCTQPGCHVATMTLFNNHIINSAGTFGSALVPCQTTVNNWTCSEASTDIYQTPAQAAANGGFSDGATGSSLPPPYGWFPTTNTAPTINAGSTAKPCATINAFDTNAGAACLNSTSLGPVYDAVNHRVTGLRQATVTHTDSGAFQFSTATASVVITNSSPVSCGSVAVGSTTSCPNITVQNVGTASATVTNVTVSDTTDYSISLNNCGVLAANATCTVQLTFKPQSGGSLSATLTVTSTAPNSPATVSVTGTGLAPAFTVTPNPVNFGSVPTGTTSSQITVTVKNTGTAQGTLSNTQYITISNPDFANAGGTCSLNQVLAVNASCTNQIQVTPGGIGPENGTLTYQGTNGLGQTITGSTTLQVTGTGAGNLTCTPSPSYNFGGWIISQTSAGQQFYCTNTGNLALTVNSVVATAPFSVPGTGQPSNFCSGSYPVNAQCSFIVVYSPTAVQNDSGTVTLSNTAAPNVVINLSGNGLPIPPPSPNPPAGAIF